MSGNTIGTLSANLGDQWLSPSLHDMTIGPDGLIKLTTGFNQGVQTTLANSRNQKNAVIEVSSMEEFLAALSKRDQHDKNPPWIRITKKIEIFPWEQKKSIGLINFRNIDFGGSSMTFAKFKQGAYFDGSNMSGMSLGATDFGTVTPWIGASMKNVNLSHADLSQACLCGVNLSWADLTFANLSWVLVNERTSAPGANIFGATRTWVMAEDVKSNTDGYTPPTRDTAFVEAKLGLVSVPPADYGRWLHNR